MLNCWNLLLTDVLWTVFNHFVLQLLPDSWWLTCCRVSLEGFFKPVDGVIHSVVFLVSKISLLITQFETDSSILAQILAQIELKRGIWVVFACLWRREVIITCLGENWENIFLIHILFQFWWNKNKIVEILCWAKKCSKFDLCMKCLLIAYKILPLNLFLYELSYHPGDGWPIG